MSYTLRTSDGVAKIGMSNSDTNTVMNKIKGRFTEINFKIVGKKIVFMIDESCNIMYGDLRIYFDKGDYFYPEGF